MKLSKFTKRQLFEELKLVILLFVTWKIILITALLGGLIFVPLRSQNFLGGGLENYLQKPYLFAWANFDGEHYLSIAKSGYGQFNHSFFPLYPLLMSPFSLIRDDLRILTLGGLLISNLSFFVALFALWQLIRLDYSREVAFFTSLALLTFPTSFYFGSVYTESLFLLLIVSSFYFARIGNFWLASILGVLSSATRITGVLLLLVLLWEWWQQNSSKFKAFAPSSGRGVQSSKFLSVVPLSLIPLGLFSYMFYLNQTTGNPLAFYTELSTFGAQRVGNFVLLPQVFYRYLKMLATVNMNDLIYWTVLLEFLVAVLIIVVLVWGYLKKVRLSYLILAILSFVLPTLTGSFSSLPRYILTIFPIFIILGLFFSAKPLVFKVAVYLLMMVLLIFETMLFLRGYWVA